MKSLASWSRIVGIAGGTVMATLLAAAGQVLALTDAEVAERLRSVPVFALTTPDGSPLVGNISNGEETVAIAELYISWQDANEFLQGLQQENPELGNQVTIRPLSLAEIFTLIIDPETNANAPRFMLVPMEEEVQSARTLMQERGEAVDEFDGVPLYYAESTQGNGGYLTVTRGEQRVIPLYFTREQIQGLLTRVSEQDPSLANTMQIQVTTLEGVISTLRAEDDPNLNNIFIVPPTESLEYIQEQAPPPAEAPPQQ